MSTRQILVTSALPYANGDIHLGHLVEYLQTDIWVRFQKLRGHDCLYVCASDAHGTPIMLRAEQAGLTPEALIEQVAARHRQDFGDFLIEFDNYHSTHSPENREIVERIYGALSAGGHIARRSIKQAYDETRGMFLPDRFVRGTCPKCGAQDQYGDSCEVCGATYAPTELIDPRSVLSGTPPSVRESEHLFFRLGSFAKMLQDWIAEGHLHPAVAAKLAEWFEAGLQDWDISRDAPYFGFQIPGETDKFFYVWLDAPVGYIASFLELSRRRDDLDFDAYWGPDSTVELYHFIGKDIVYFHALFWPAVLAGSGFRTPDGIFAHGFLTVNGQKMSKSRGTFITARSYLDHLEPEYLRYYYAAKLGPGIDDIDLNLEDFVARVNADLVGKVVNIASRCAGFIHKLGGGRLGTHLHAPELHDSFAAAAGSIASAYESREFSRAMREIMQLADRANQYIDQHKPWVLAREGETAAALDVCTQGLNLYRQLVIFLKPVLPEVAKASETLLRLPPLTWADLDTPLLDREIEAFSPLLSRIEPARVEALVAAARTAAAAAATPDAGAG
ncbi:MAG: methionine--tRNA ligase [Gammaproteobacteria bacterium]|nr:MAG: methionine--tRNA ligase [Gammaproteobacteria bacterium]